MTEPDLVFAAFAAAVAAVMGLSYRAARPAPRLDPSGPVRVLFGACFLLVWGGTAAAFVFLPTAAPAWFAAYAAAVVAVPVFDLVRTVLFWTSPGIDLCNRVMGVNTPDREEVVPGEGPAG